MKQLSFPALSGGKITDCVFDPNGNVCEIWIVLNPNSESIEFSSEFNIICGARVHLNTVAGAMSK